MKKENAKLLKDKVYFCLQNYERTRNSDKVLLCTIYWIFYRKYLIENKGGGLFTQAFSIPLSAILYDLPSSESICRCRRKIQEQGYWRATEVIERTRAESESDIRHSINTEKWNHYLPK